MSEPRAIPRPLEIQPFSDGRRIQLAALVLAILASIAVLFGFALTPDQMMFSYLTSFVFCFGLSFGALAWLMAFHAANARWVVVVRRPLEILSSLMPLWAVLFIPIVVGMKHLYPWVSPDPARGAHFLATVHHQIKYLNVPGFVSRAAVYFMLWSYLGHRLYRNSLEQDRVPESDRTLRIALKNRWFSSVGLPLSGVAITFAGFDWLMSLDPTFRSTIFSLYYFAGAFVAAMALLIVLVYLLDQEGALAGLVSAHHYHNLGKLLFAFVCFWAYIAFAQYMLIWIANLPENEIPFYLLRMRHGWRAVSLFLVAGHFFVPFVFLMPAAVKKHPRRVAGFAVWMLFAHAVDEYWLVNPFHDATPICHWQDIAAFIALGSIGTSLFLLRLRGRLPIPAGDPYYEDSVVFDK